MDGCVSDLYNDGGVAGYPYQRRNRGRRHSPCLGHSCPERENRIFQVNTLF